MDAKLLHDMFDLGIPVAEKVLRPILVYAFLVIGLRLAGKRELAQLNAFDLVVLLTLSNTVQNAIIGDDNSVSGGIIGATTLLVVNYWVVRFLYGHQKLEELVEGGATVLIDDGKILERNLKQELITIHELEAAAHKQGLSSLDEVEHAELEIGGTISFTARKPTAETVRHDEVMARLDALARELKTLGSRSPAAAADGR
ncbi:MAG: DUF421 domain-containing protein [Deltaproteobacteria bacterium]|nr:DUF421 domain-containing protein [Deltaproteobacteria bacterium]